MRRAAARLLLLAGLAPALAACFGPDKEGPSLKTLGQCPDRVDERAVGMVLVFPRGGAAAWPGIEHAPIKPPKDGFWVDLSTFPLGTRLIAPGTVVTKDHRPKRMNVTVDERAVITAVTCG